MSLSPSPPPAPPPRKFLFKRANLGAPTEPNKKDDIGFFSRREQNYSAVIDKPVEEPIHERKKSHVPEDSDGDEGSPPKRTKRGSVVDDDEDSGEEIISTQRRHASTRQRYNAIVLSDSDDEPSPKESSPKARKSKSKSKSKAKPRTRDTSLTPPPVLYTDNTPPKPVSRTTSSSNPPSRAISGSRNTSPPRPVVSIEDDDDEVVLTGANKSPPPAPTPVDEEDEYIAALEKRARERALAAQRASNTPSFTSTPPSDPIVSILVTSKIKGTEPLMLKRRVNQALKPVRTTWCKKQGFPEDQAEDIFLTWRGNKVFDHNSCRGIGIIVDDLGNLDNQDGMLDSNIHFEAMTAEGFAEMERERERGYSAPDVEEEEEEVPEKEEVIMRLTLKSKGYEEFKIKVRPETKLVKLISAFRTARKIPDDKEITLKFDGDDLDPEETVGDTELEDLFGIDVYIN